MLLLKVFNFYFFSVYKIWSLIVQAGPELLSFIKYYMCVCVHACVCAAWYASMHKTMCAFLWRSEVSSHLLHVVPRNQTQVIRLFGNHLYLQIHFAHA